MDVAGNTRSFPNYSLSLLCIMFWKLLFSSKLFIAYRSYIQSSSCSPPNLCYSVFTWFSHLHLILFERLPKFLCSLSFLTGRIFPITIYLLMCGHLLSSISSCHHYLSGHLKNRGYPISSIAHRKHLPILLTPYLLGNLNFFFIFNIHEDLFLPYKRRGTLHNKRM